MISSTTYAADAASLASMHHHSAPCLPDAPEADKTRPRAFHPPRVRSSPHILRMHRILDFPVRAIEIFRTDSKHHPPSFPGFKP